MAENFTANPGAGGETFAADDVSGIKYPYSKIDIGADGASSPVTAANPLPTALSAAQIAALVEVKPEGAPAPYWPSYGAPTESGNQGQNIDSGGALVTRSAVLTDEGTFRVNFANSSLSVGIGTVSVSGKVVTGAGFAASDVHLKDYFKLDADAETAWRQIDSIDSDTQITLVSDYGGGVSGAASRALVQPVTGAGGSITVVSGQCLVASGVTSGSRSFLSRRLDYGPLVLRETIGVSQRIANQNVRIGLSEASPTPRWFARFRLEGVVNTVVICESARNPTTTPSVAETESRTVTIPGGLTTAALLDYRIEQLTESVRFYINGILVAENFKSLPTAYDFMSAGTLIENTGVPASSTTVTVDYITVKNHNKLEIGVMSDAERIVAASAPLLPHNFAQAGVIAINTDLVVIDCQQYRSLMIQCASMGTTGNVTPQWCNEPTFAQPITATLQSENGATSTTFNAAVMRVTNVVARYFRLRLTTATTAGQTTINAWGCQQSLELPLATQPVSGTVTATVTNGTVINTPVTPTTTFVNSAATTNALIVKASAGTLWSLVASNTNAATRFLKLHNIATLPAPGTTPVAITVAIPSGGTVTLNGGSNGIRFAAGIGQSITAAAADADTTVIAAGDVKVAWTFT